MKFAILTGGGDSPGMNAFIRAIVRCSLNLRPSSSVWGVIDGWRGLVEGNFRKLVNEIRQASHLPEEQSLVHCVYQN